ncbi:translation initiation factor IF-2-like [Mustela erminea]|uniref:translation initiation factor IF-2-like n=1 Tax=Mustela erminea TaxID=36723 RepID=UPI001386D6DB|nr:translation initiation factor IF-2-like [Mustela erminea]
MGPPRNEDLTRPPPSTQSTARPRSTRKPTLNSAARAQGNRPRRAAALSASRPSFGVSARTSADPRAAPGPRQCVRPASRDARAPRGGKPGGGNPAGVPLAARETELDATSDVRKRSTAPPYAFPKSGFGARDGRRARRGRGHPLPRPGRGPAPSALAPPPGAPPRALSGALLHPLPARLSFLLSRAPSPSPPLTHLAREGRGPGRRSGPLPPAAAGSCGTWNPAGQPAASRSFRTQNL